VHTKQKFYHSDTFPTPKQVLKKMQKQSNGGSIVFSTHDAAVTEYSERSMTIYVNLIPYAKINSKWIIDIM
jgi:ABC-type lipoprotein export system ATPase subunit